MKDFTELFETASAAGRLAATSAVPVPMHIAGYAPVSEGACGFAWVNIKPGNSAFARWLKAKKLAQSDSYYGGVTVWISEYNQSLHRKEAHARAMAEVLKQAGFRVYAYSRMD